MKALWKKDAAGIIQSLQNRATELIETTTKVSSLPSGTLVRILFTIQIHTLGIGSAIDRFMETDKHVFAILGPNSYYGPISLVFSRECLYVSISRARDIALKVANQQLSTLVLQYYPILLL